MGVAEVKDGRHVICLGAHQRQASVGRDANRRSGREVVPLRGPGASAGVLRRGVIKRSSGEAEHEIVRQRRSEAQPHWNREVCRV